MHVIEITGHYNQMNLERLLSETNSDKKIVWLVFYSKIEIYKLQENST